MPNSQQDEPLTFSKVMELTERVSSPAAFEEPECRAYFDLLMSLPRFANIVEIGLQFGRSSSIALQVAKANGLRYHGIDPFTDPAAAYWSWLSMASEIEVPFRLSKMRSGNVMLAEGEEISLILIDGDHSYAQVLSDCNNFLCFVEHGGYALFHDYGRDSLPSVYDAVNYYFADSVHWYLPEVVGTLAMFKRK